MVYPFSAIVGQDGLKEALLLHAIDPRIGGVVILGHRGTAKSTAVRSLARLLPPIPVVFGCRFHCDPARPESHCTECRDRAERRTHQDEHIRIPVVDLPLGATEDRVVGGLDVEAALADGRKVFAPGLLAQAHRGFLYIDEVNLLDDHLVDLILDAAASGVNVIEREGVSLRHPAEFVLIGSGNPEEGDLRPQLLDRFGLCVHVETVGDLAQRAEIVRRRYAYESDPAAFRASWAAEEAALQERIVDARSRLGRIQIPEAAPLAVAAAAERLQIQGHRGEVTTLKAAVAMAAWQGSATLGADHVRNVAVLALRHRLPDPHATAAGMSEIEQAVEAALRRYPLAEEV